MPFVPETVTDPAEKSSKDETAMPTTTFKPAVFHPIRPPRTEPLPEELANDNKLSMETQIPKPLTNIELATEPSSVAAVGNGGTQNTSEF